MDTAPNSPFAEVEAPGLDGKAAASVINNDFHNPAYFNPIVREAVSISPNGNLKGAANLMRIKQVSALAVVCNKKIVGLVTEHDIVEALSTHSETAGFIRVKDAMKQHIPSISPVDTVRQTILLMAKKNCTDLPMVNSGILAGMVSLGDLLKYQLEEANTPLCMINEFAHLPLWQRETVLCPDWRRNGRK